MKLDEYDAYQLVPTGASAPPYNENYNFDEPDTSARPASVNRLSELVVRQSHPIAPIERVHLVQATPFRPVPICPPDHQDDMSEVDNNLLMVYGAFDVMPPLDSYSNASTGNISSTERLEENQDSSEDVSSNETVPVVVTDYSSLPLAVSRSLSLELLNSNRPRLGLSSFNSQSDPCLPLQQRRRRNSTGGESYSYRCVQLSNHRIPSQSIESLGKNL